MKIKDKDLGTIDKNKLLIKRRVMLFNKSIPHKNKKKEKEKFKTRKPIDY